MHVTIAHHDTHSIVSLIGESGDTIGTIDYTRKIHRYESESAFRTIVTELRTYGDRAAQETFNYYHSRSH